MKVVFIILSLVLGVGCGRTLAQHDTTTPAKTCAGFMPNPNGGSLKWAGAFPIQVIVDISVPPRFKSSIQKAMSTWNAALESSAFVFGDSDSQNVVALRWATEWSKVGSRSVDAQSTDRLVWNKAGIISADIFFNAEYFDFSTSPGPDEVDFESVALHEFGHILGLDHVADENSVMFKDLKVGLLRRELRVQDKQRLSCEYDSR